MNALDERVVPRAWDILLLVPMALAGLAIDSDRLSAALKGLRQKLIPKLPGIGYASQSERWQHDVLDYVVTACEMAYGKSLPISVVEHGLSIVAEFSRPYQRGSSRFTASALDILLRAWLLHQKINELPVSSETFLDFVDPKPPESKVASVKVKKGRNETRQVDRLDDTQRRFVATVFPVYEGRLNALAYAAGHGCVKPEHLAQLGGFGSDIYYVDRDVDGTGIRTTVGESILKLSHLPGASWQALYDHALGLVQTAYQDPFAKRLLRLWRILLLRQETQGLLVKKITEKVGQTKLAKEPASAKVEACCEFSQIVLDFSEPDAQSLFEQAVVFAQELDRETFDQVRALAATSSHFASWKRSERERAALLAADVFTEIAERLRDQEHFPWEECVRVLTRLNPPVAFALVSRWSDLGIRSHERTIADLLGDLLDSQLTSSSIAASLFGINQPVPAELIVNVISRCSAEEASKVIDLVSADCLLFERPTDVLWVGEKIVDAVLKAPAGGDSPAFKELERQVSFLRDTAIAVRSKVQEVTTLSQIDARGFDCKTPAGVEA